MVELSAQLLIRRWACLKWSVIGAGGPFGRWRRHHGRYAHLLFARWLVQTGRLSDFPRSEIGSTSALRS